MSTRYPIDRELHYAVSKIILLIQANVIRHVHVTNFVFFSAVRTSHRCGDFNLDGRMNYAIHAIRPKDSISNGTQRRQQIAIINTYIFFSEWIQLFVMFCSMLSSCIGRQADSATLGVAHAHLRTCRRLSDRVRPWDAVCVRRLQLSSGSVGTRSGRVRADRGAARGDGHLLEPKSTRRKSNFPSGLWLLWARSECVSTVAVFELCER